jgi:hypothetical protein
MLILTDSESGSTARCYKSAHLIEKVNTQVKTGLLFNAKLRHPGATRLPDRARAVGRRNGCLAVSSNSNTSGSFGSKYALFSLSLRGSFQAGNVSVAS